MRRQVVRHLQPKGKIFFLVKSLLMSNYKIIEKRHFRNCSTDL